MKNPNYLKRNRSNNSFENNNLQKQTSVLLKKNK